MAPGIRRSRARANIKRVAATDAPIPTAMMSRIRRMFIRSKNQLVPNPPAAPGCARTIMGPMAALPAHLDTSSPKPIACE